MLFRYEAIDRSGKVVRGAMNAADEQAVARKLVSMGYSLNSIVQPGGTTQQAGSSPAGTAAAPARSPVQAARPSIPVSVAPCVSVRTLSRYYRQLATMVRAGMPLFQALVDLEAATHNGKLRRAARELAACVQNGESQSSAMARSPKLFPVHTVGIIWAGELGGYLDKALDEAATELEQEGKDGLWASVGWFLTNLNIFFLITIMPMWDVAGFFTNVATNVPVGGGDIPTVDVTAALRVVAEEYMKGFWRLSVPTLVGWVLLSFAWKRLKRVPSVRMTIDRLLLMVPNWGTLHRERARQRFTKSLQQQYQAGVPTAQAWAAASMTVRNSEIASRLRVLDETLRRADGNLQSALVQSGVFSHEDANMVGTGERSGSVPEMLERLSDYHGDVAGGAKIKGRLIAVNLMIIGLTVISGYFTIKIFAAFYQVAAKFGGV